MILDGNLLFDSGLALTATQTSSNVIDLLNARDMGIGEHPSLKLMVDVVTALVSAGSTTLVVQVQGSTDNSTFAVYAESRAIAKAALVAGARAFDISLPRPGPGDALPRYLRLNYVVAVSNFTGGTITSALVLGRDDIPVYPPGVVVAN